MVDLPYELQPLFKGAASVPAEAVVRVHLLTNMDIENAFSPAQKLDEIVSEVNARLTSEDANNLAIWCWFHMPFNERATAVLAANELTAWGMNPGPKANYDAAVAEIGSTIYRHAREEGDLARNLAMLLRADPPTRALIGFTLPVLRVQRPDAAVVQCKYPCGSELPWPDSHQHRTGTWQIHHLSEKLHGGSAEPYNAVALPPYEHELTHAANRVACYVKCIPATPADNIGADVKNFHKYYTMEEQG